MRGTGGQVLYLDFDGVLHHEDVLWHHKVGPYISPVVPSKYKLFAHVSLLEENLQNYPDVQIVLSTSWSRIYGMTKAAKNLGHNLRHRVIGNTFHTLMNEDHFTAKPRGVQVTEDVLRRKPAQWLALDDNSEGWPNWAQDNFIRTHDTEGISDPMVLATFRSKLKERFG